MDLLLPIVLIHLIVVRHCHLIASPAPASRTRTRLGRRYSLLPIVRRFTGPAGIAVEKIDISVAARILAQFPERLSEAQRVDDTLGALGQIVLGPGANVCVSHSYSGSHSHCSYFISIASFA
jgi:hypothetical protein